MANKTIKISGIGDVDRSAFLRAITDPDSFREYADEQGWGNKRRQMAYKSLQDYAQGVQNDDINEINDMHQIIDDTGVRKNKEEKYNWFGSKFDANGATASYMNKIAKQMSEATKPTLKAVPKVSDYLNQQWFGGNDPDWTLFQKNDAANKGVYGITNRLAKMKAGLTSLRDELTNNGAQYNWDGVNKDLLMSSLNNAINNPSNYASYAPLGITSQYLNDALATRDLTTSIDGSETPQTTTQDVQVNQPSSPSYIEVNNGVPSTNVDKVTLQDYYNSLPDDQKQSFAGMSKEEQNALFNNWKQERVAARNKSLKDMEDKAFIAYLKQSGHYSPKSELTIKLPHISAANPSSENKGYDFDWKRAHMNLTPTNQEWNIIRTTDDVKSLQKLLKMKTSITRHVKNSNNEREDISIGDKLSGLLYTWNSITAQDLNNTYMDDVSSYAGLPKGTLFRVKNSKTKRGWLYIRRKGNSIDLYRSPTWGELRKQWKHKNGGVLKAQSGDTLRNPEAYAKWRAQKIQQLEADKTAVAKQARAKSFAIDQKKTQRMLLGDPRTPQQLQAGQRELGDVFSGDLTNTDIARLGGVVADLASLGLSFTPASEFGVVAGLASTAANAYADANDPSVSTGEAITNGLLNGGLDLVGAIPVIGSWGKVQKLGRIANFLSKNTKLANRVMAAIAAPAVISAAPGAYNAFTKIRKGDFSSVTADELRDLGVASSMVFGGMIRNKGIDTKRVKKTNKVTVKTDRGDVTINRKIYDNIMSGKTMDARNSDLSHYIGKPTQFDNSLLHNYAPAKWFGGGWSSVSKFTPMFRSVNAARPNYRFKDEHLSEVMKRAENIHDIRMQTGNLRSTNKEVPALTAHEQSRLAASATRGGRKSNDLFSTSEVEKIAGRITSPFNEGKMPQEVVDMYKKILPDRFNSSKAEENRLRAEKLEKQLKEIYKAEKRKRTKGYNNSDEFTQHLLDIINHRKDGGILYVPDFLKRAKLFAKGGIIKAQDGKKFDGSYTNIFGEGNPDLGYNTYLNKIFLQPRMLQWYRYTYTDPTTALKRMEEDTKRNVDYREVNGINDYNNSQRYISNAGVRAFNTSYQNNGITPNYVLFGDNADNYSNMKGAIYSLVKFVRPNKSINTGDSYSDDKTKAYIDGAKGLQTYSRVLSLTDPNIKAGGFGDWGKTWADIGKATGAYYYKDKSGKGQWIPTNDTKVEGYVPFEAQQQTQQKKKGSETDPTDTKASIFDKINGYLKGLKNKDWYNEAELGKYLLANKYNEDIHKVREQGWSETPKHTSRQISDNLARVNAYQQQAADLQRQGSETISSDAQAQYKARLAANAQAAQTLNQGNIERNTDLNEQREKAYQAGVYNMENSTDTANRNRYNAYLVDKDNRAFERDYIRSKATNTQNFVNALEQHNIIEPYAEAKYLDMQQTQEKAKWDLDHNPLVANAAQAFNKVYQANKDNPAWDYSTDKSWTTYQDALNKAHQSYQNSIYNGYSKWNKLFTPIKFKKGGSTYNDVAMFNAKMFRDTVKHSINTATKQGGDTNKILTAFIKKNVKA